MASSQHSRADIWTLSACIFVHHFIRNPSHSSQTEMGVNTKVIDVKQNLFGGRNHQDPGHQELETRSYPLGNGAPWVTAPCLQPPPVRVKHSPRAGPVMAPQDLRGAKAGLKPQWSDLKKSAGVPHHQNVLHTQARPPAKPRVVPLMTISPLMHLLTREHLFPHTGVTHEHHHVALWRPWVKSY